MKTFKIEFKDYGKNNHGIHAEFSLCEYYGIHRTKHDNIAFDKGSDIELGEKHISVKSARFTLASGSLNEGFTDFDSIWKIYESKVVSNVFTYVDSNGNCYEMNLTEFKKFVYEFCTVQRDSDNTMKLRAKHESKKMLDYLRNQVI